MIKYNKIKEYVCIKIWINWRDGGWWTNW